MIEDAISVEVLENDKEEQIKSYDELYDERYRLIQDFYPNDNLYIFGHSLDATDGDILKKLILNDNVTTTIFYHDNNQYEQEVKNLNMILGRENLIKL